VYILKMTSTPLPPFGRCPAAPTLPGAASTKIKPACTQRRNRFWVESVSLSLRNATATYAVALHYIDKGWWTIRSQPDGSTFTIASHTHTNALVTFLHRCAAETHKRREEIRKWRLAEVCKWLLKVCLQNDSTVHWDIDETRSSAVELFSWLSVFDLRWNWRT
jgi:hypothetical protein